MSKSASTRAGRRSRSCARSSSPGALQRRVVTRRSLHQGTIIRRLAALPCAGRRPREAQLEQARHSGPARPRACASRKSGPWDASNNLLLAGGVRLYSAARWLSRSGRPRRRAATSGEHSIRSRRRASTSARPVIDRSGPTTCVQTAVRTRAARSSRSAAKRRSGPARAGAVYDRRPPALNYDE